MLSFARAALLVLAAAVPASAAPDVPTECVKQYLIVAEPAPRPIRFEGGGVGIYPGDLTDKVARDVTRTATLVACLT